MKFNPAKPVKIVLRTKNGTIEVQKQEWDALTSVFPNLPSFEDLKYNTHVAAITAVE